MSGNQYLRMIEAARLVVDEIAAWLENHPRIPIDADQLRRSSTSVTLNLVEGLGRRPGADRARFLIYARASAEESNEILRTCHAANSLEASQYWRLHNRLVTVVRMVDAYLKKMH